MKADNKGAGEDMKFIFWDDPGDSQDSVDNQCDCPPWKTEIAYNELRKPCCIARENQERTHHPEYDDKEKEDNEPHK